MAVLRLKPPEAGELETQANKQMKKTQHEVSRFSPPARPGLCGSTAAPCSGCRAPAGCPSPLVTPAAPGSPPQTRSHRRPARRPHQHSAGRLTRPACASRLRPAERSAARDGLLRAPPPRARPRGPVLTGALGGSARPGQRPPRSPAPGTGSPAPSRPGPALRPAAPAEGGSGRSGSRPPPSGRAGSSPAASVAGRGGMWRPGAAGAVLAARRAAAARRQSGGPGGAPLPGAANAGRGRTVRVRGAARRGLRRREEGAAGGEGRAAGGVSSAGHGPLVAPRRARGQDGSHSPRRALRGPDQRALPPRRGRPLAPCRASPCERR